MKLTIPHNSDRETVRRKIEMRLQALMGQYTQYLNDVEHHWEGDRLLLKGSAKGFKAHGSVEVTDSEVIIDGKLPLIAKPFEPRIKNTIEKEAESMFRTA